MKIDNYLSRWEEFRHWSEANRPEILANVVSLGDDLKDCIKAYRQATDPDERNERLALIKQHYDRIVQWHMQEILSKLDGGRV